MKVSLKSDWWLVLALFVLSASLFCLSIYLYDFTGFLIELILFVFWLSLFAAILFTIALAINFIKHRSTVLRKETKIGLIILMAIFIVFLMNL